MPPTGRSGTDPTIYANACSTSPVSSPGWRSFCALKARSLLNFLRAVEERNVRRSELRGSRRRFESKGCTSEAENRSARTEGDVVPPAGPPQHGNTHAGARSGDHRVHRAGEDRGNFDPTVLNPTPLGVGSWELEVVSVPTGRDSIRPRPTP